MPETAAGLTPTEIDVLRHLNGDAAPGLVWGAAMSEACGVLAGRGLITPPPMCFITAAGRAVLEEADPGREGTP